MYVIDEVNLTLLNILNSSEGLNRVKLFSSLIQSNLAYLGLREADELSKSEMTFLILTPIRFEPF